MSRAAAPRGGARAVWPPAAICACYLGQLALVVYLAHHARYPASEFFNQVPGALPIARIADRLPFRVVPPVLIGQAWTYALAVVCGIVQAACIYVFYRTASRDGCTGIVRASAIASVAIMAAASLALPYASSADAYAYVGYGLAPTLHASFETAASPMPPGFEAINEMYGLPEVPNLYGAGLYALMSYARFAHAPLIVDLYVLRVLCLLAFAATLALLRRRLPACALWTLALCPAIYDDYVLNAHNDVFAILLTVVALVTMSERVWLAVVAVAAAATFKLTLLLTGVTLVALRAKRLERLALAATMVVGAYLAVHTFDGGALSTSISTHVTTPQQAVAKAPGRPVHAALQLLIGFGAIVTAGIAVVFGRASSANAFVLALHPAAYPWYQPWGLAYAALTPEFFWLVPAGLAAITPALQRQPFGPATQEFAWPFALGLALVFTLRRAYRRPARDLTSARSAARRRPA